MEPVSIVSHQQAISGDFQKLRLVFADIYAGRSLMFISSESSKSKRFPLLAFGREKCLLEVKNILDLGRLPKIFDDFSKFCLVLADIYAYRS